MKNRIIAMALVIVMLFALSACGKKQEAAPTPAPTEAPATPAPTATPEPTPEPTAEPVSVPVEPDSGVHTIKSTTKNFSIDYDSKYVANELPSGAIIVNAGTEEGIPYVTVSIMEKEIMGQQNVTDATTYLLSLSQSAVEELGDAIISAPSQLPSPIEGRDLIGFYYVFQDGGNNIVCTYFAEKTENDSIVVYNARSLEGEDLTTVNSILQLAVESFKLTA
ncbi:MAG: hypothetical protein IJQ36_05695 [Oscillospiraceae bacterium]|nr:hypothetical protein [Oscillospiraceae bacterium]